MNTIAKNEDIIRKMKIVGIPAPEQIEDYFYDDEEH